MKAYKSLVNTSIKHGFTVSVFDGEEWQVKRSQQPKAIFDAIESVEEAQLRFRDMDGCKCGWAVVSAFGLQDEETVIDHSCVDNAVPTSAMFQWLDNWSEQYNLIGA